MALQLNDTAPDFEAETTEGRISFHEWIGDSWAVLFSHPKDFTPVCTTELGYMAKIKPEFDRREREGHRPLGRSVDKHEEWAQRHRGDAGHGAELPDHRRRRLQRREAVRDARRPTSRATRGDRTPADNQTVRNVFVIGPDKKVKLILVYPMTTGRNFDEVLRVIDSLQLTAKHKVATPVNWQQGDNVIIAGSVSERRGQGDLSGRLGIAQALHQDRAAAQLRFRAPPRNGNGDGPPVPVRAVAV